MTVRGGDDVDTLHSIERVVGSAQADYLTYSGSIPLGYSLEIDAGAGIDVVANAAGATTNIVIAIDSLGNGTLTSAGGGTIQLRNFHTQIIGSQYDDEITDLAEHGGVKRIDGGDGDDVVTIGGDGRARLGGGAGDDMLTGGDGSDVLIGGDGDNQLFGGGGTDMLISDSAQDSDLLDGGAGSDLLIARGEFSSIRGGAGNDLIDAREGGGAIMHFGANDGHDTLEGEAYVGTPGNWSLGVARVEAQHSVYA